MMRWVFLLLLTVAAAAQQTGGGGVPGTSSGSSGPVTYAPTLTVGQLINGPQTSLAASGTTYYVDNINGSDSNAGTSQATAWKTLAKVNASTFSAGSQVLLLSTDVFHEQLTVPSAGMTFGAYGPQQHCSLSSALVAACTYMPIIDGADAITGWTVQSGSTYQATYTATASKGFVDALYTQTAPLALQTSVAQVNATAGSIYSNGSLVYVHLLDGSNPANHVVEVAGARKYGINLNNQAGTSIMGLEIIRAAKSGVVQGSAYPANITISNNVFFNIGDTLGDAGTGPGPSNEGAIYDYTGFCSCTLVNWVLAGNWIGEMDFPAADLDFNQAGIQLGASTAVKVIANKVATVHGAGIRLADSYGSACTYPTVSENELTNSEGNVWLLGCANATVTYNNAHDTFGNFLEIGNGNLAADVTNNAPYVAFNLFHDILPAYGNTLFNGIDTNYATNGTYYMNRCWKVSAACLTLEGAGSAATSSSGSTVQFNNFDTSQNYSSTGVSGSGTAYPMYVVPTALTGTTGRGNSFVFDPTSSSGIWYGGVSYNQAQFDAAYPRFEVAGPGVLTAPAFFPQSVTAGPYSVLFDDFYSGANNAANNIGAPTGASCGVNTTYTDANHPGNLLLTAGTGGTGTGITCGYQSQNASVVAPNSATQGWTWETAVYVPVLPGTTAGSFQAGLTGSPNANPWTTGIQFYLSSANGVANDWYCRYGSTSIDSTIAAAAATWTRLTMANDGTYVHWYVNGTEATACKTVVGSMPAGNQYPASWSATALSGSSVTMSVDYVDFQRAMAR